MHANTPVGGKIIAGLDDGKHVTLLVEDNGIGIQTPN